MNSTAAVQNVNKDKEIKDINIHDVNVKDEGKDLHGRQNLLIMTLFSLLVMLIAVGLIYYYVKVDPGIVHENDQSTAAAENSAFINPDSLQQLENDTSKITMKPVENSTPFIICGGVFMVIIAGAFIYVKVAESKEDN